jgi:hypothetical protein
MTLLLPEQETWAIEVFFCGMGISEESLEAGKVVFQTFLGVIEGVLKALRADMNSIRANRGREMRSHAVFEVFVRRPVAPHSAGSGSFVALG